MRAGVLRSVCGQYNFKFWVVARHLASQLAVACHLLREDGSLVASNSSEVPRFQIE